MFSWNKKILVLCTMLCAAISTAFAVPQPYSSSPVVLSESINPHPATAFSHASTILGCKGWMLAAWFGGTREQATDTGIWLSRRMDGQWTKPVEVANGVQSDGTRLPVWNPVLFSPRHGPVMLFYTVGATSRNWWPMRMVSWDQGKTWSVPQRLAAGITGPAKNKPVQLEDGTIISPGSTETSEWNIRFALSRDGAQTWREIDPPRAAVHIDAIQPTILNHHGGHIEAVGRTREGHLFSVSSSDYGRHWSSMTLLPLLNPNSGIDGVTLSDGRDLLVLNPTPLESGEKGRWRLTVFVSSDHKTWNEVLDLENEKGEEFSYPAVIQTPDHLIHITYTYKRREIRHVVLDPARI
ncbi:hypothetical protein BGV71_12475 [Burkholderia ubonensis]|uniref:sialidase family protein n=1 Tax=Burkholderia ubonensis TaxID=101571 RepID=UPI000759B3D2|nr:sialidase family protein [Burkholderia ubonensis]KVR07248.1 hypothetical protein WK09_24825 [Burkholderia ubonensis]KVX10702.1 hypothetical protein WL03_25650 [Burkholderia ubonensis]KWC01544.1 hypothetical protein WL43_23070 [Burkholderia ubonensis]OJA84334.1 hypothetical protein BGV71_12475 [Burkholderia ubonensis]